LIYLGSGIGARGLGKQTTAGFVVLGTFHALLQLLPPFLFLRIGSSCRFFWHSGNRGFAALGMFLVRRMASRWVLLFVWLLLVY